MKVKYGTVKARVLRYVTLRSAHQRPPTTREIAQAIRSRSHGEVAKYLRELAAEGLITLEPGAARTARVVVSGPVRDLRAAEFVAFAPMIDAS